MRRPPSAGLVTHARIWDADYVFRTAILGSADSVADPGFGRNDMQDADSMAREISIGSRRFWIVSEPFERGWRAQVLEVLNDRGNTKRVGIEAIGETRGVADDRAVGQLQHRLRE